MTHVGELHRNRAVLLLECAGARRYAGRMKAAPDPHPDVMEFLRGLMPDADDAKLRECHESLLRYVGLVARIYERLEREGRGIADSRTEETDATIRPA
jgi:hypothetical protein